MTQGYRDALLEYLALSHLMDELRGRTDRYEVRTEAGNRQLAAQEKLEKILLKQAR